MDTFTNYISGLIRDVRTMDRVKLARELRELAYHAKKQVFGQIPSVSAVAGILVGSWVAGTFTNSPVKGFLASWGFMKGGTHVVSTTTYRILSVALPILATALTAYAVQKAMKAYREKQLERNREVSAHLGKELQAELKHKLGILDAAREAGLVSENEYRTKLAALYQSYSRTGSQIEELIINKLEN